MTPHELSVRSVGDVCVITLGQDVDTAVAGRLEAEIVALTTPSVPLVVDLSGVDFLDSAGVRLMDRLVGRHRRAGSTAVMVAPTNGAPWFTLRMCEFPDEHLATSVRAAVEAAAAPSRQAAAVPPVPPAQSGPVPSPPAVAVPPAPSRPVPPALTVAVPSAPSRPVPRPPSRPAPPATAVASGNSSSDQDS